MATRILSELCRRDTREPELWDRQLWRSRCPIEHGPGFPSTTRTGGLSPAPTSRSWPRVRLGPPCTSSPATLPVGARTRLVDAVLDAPEVRLCQHVQVALPLGRQRDP